MFDRTIEPTTSDIVGTLTETPLDVSRYGAHTQETIIARSIALAQSVREAEDRAAVALAAEARALIPVGTAHSVRAHRTSREAEACGDFPAHMREVAAIQRRKRIERAFALFDAMPATLTRTRCPRQRCVKSGGHTGKHRNKYGLPVVGN